MRMPQLLKLAGQWNMKITTIKAPSRTTDKQHDKLVNALPSPICQPVTAP